MSRLDDLLGGKGGSGGLGRLPPENELDDLFGQLAGMSGRQ
jgi:hypothetical protein